jgi:hypothetical protein
MLAEQDRALVIREADASGDYILGRECSLPGALMCIDVE